VVAACDARHRPLRAAQLYRVAVNDFLVGGGDDFKGFAGLPVATVGPLDTEALESYLQSVHGEIALPSGPRIFVTGGPPLRCQATSSP
jgi:2',3'-cyclic-nucleotide 2'-phosphodiesterase (5'-nucleotidase family)